MDIKECKSSDFIREEIRIKLIEIKNIIEKNYIEELCIYNNPRMFYIQIMGEKNIHITKIFGINIFKDIYYKDILYVDFRDRKLEITIKDPSEFLYPIVKFQFSEFAQINKESIKSLCFIKDY